MIIKKSKQIIQSLLARVIGAGNLNLYFSIHYRELANELDLNEEYCRVCCQYLNELGYIHLIENENADSLMRLTAKGIDFLFSP